MIANWLKNKVHPDCIVFADLPGEDFKPISDIFHSLRPDLVISYLGKLLTIELTICHETNITESREYKINKYKDLKKFRVDSAKNLDLTLTTCELTTLGFLQIDKSILSKFQIPPFDENLISQLTQQVIKLSFDIYAHRDSVI